MADVTVYAIANDLLRGKKNMIIATTYVNMALATAVDGGYEFTYNVYNSVKAATAFFLLNNGTIQSAPCIVTKRPSGTYVVTYSNTSLYVSPSTPNKLLTSDPD